MPVAQTMQHEPFSSLSRPVLALVLSIIAATLSYRHGSLSSGGAAGAVVVGTATAGLGGWDWGLLVIIFFVTSSALSRLGLGRKERLAAEHWEKGARRDWGQVMANGGLVSTLALAYFLWPAPAIWAMAIGVLATVTGDTWATEVGVLSRGSPRLITTGRMVAPGTSGAVTVLGSLAALSGATCIGVAALLLGGLPQDGLPFWVIPSALAGGFAGVATDSLLGATVQAINWCPRCGSETERPVHSCGSTTTRLRGWSWLTNDAVNAIASAVGGAVAAGAAVLLQA